MNDMNETKQETTQEGELKEAMARLETALLSPVLSGELESWVQTVEQSARALDQRLQPYINTVLHAQYKEIAKSDQELLSRVEQMVAEDQQLVAEYQLFLSDLDDLARRVPEVKKHESKVAEQRELVSEQGEALIIRIRKLQVAAATWLNEACYRDRGPVD